MSEFLAMQFHQSFNLLQIHIISWTLCS